jgi:acetaldehyde dehydrogenase (acetylating)
MDNDLTSIQEARDLISSAYAAWQSWSHATQADVDRVCEAMAEAGVQAAERLGQLAYDETGYGHPLHKKLKNITGSRLVWESIRAEKTVGVIKHDPEKKVTEIAWPIGVIAALVPSTNPTSTTLYKALIAV